MKKIKLAGREKILIVRPDRIGDLVLTLPMAKCLRSYYPDLRIEFLVSDYNAPVLKYVDYADDFIKIGPNGGQLRALLAELEKKSYDIVIFAKPNWRTAFAAFLAAIPLRIGTGRRFYSVLFNRRLNYSRKYSNCHEVDLNLAMLQVFGIKLAAGSLYPEMHVNMCGRGGLPAIANGEKYIIIHPGSKGSAPNWPSKFYLELIKKLSKQLRIIVTGQGDKIPGLADDIIDMTNKTDFDGLVEAIAGACLFISGSTGPLHMAAALGVPALGLYPGHPVLGPQRWGPRGNKANCLTPAKQNGPNLSKNDDVRYNNLSLISVDTVYQKVIEILKAETV